MLNRYSRIVENAQEARVALETSQQRGVLQGAVGVVKTLYAE